MRQTATWTALLGLGLLWAGCDNGPPQGACRQFFFALKACQPTWADGATICEGLEREHPTCDYTDYFTVATDTLECHDPVATWAWGDLPTC